MYPPYVLRYAPAEQRFEHIIQRLIAIPRLVRQAEQNLVDSPEVWNKVAREENAGNIDLIDGVLRAACPQAFGKNYLLAAGPSLSACIEFSEFLEGSLAYRHSAWLIAMVIS